MGFNQIGTRAMTFSGADVAAGEHDGTISIRRHLPAPVRVDPVKRTTHDAQHKPCLSALERLAGPR